MSRGGRIPGDAVALVPIAVEASRRGAREVLRYWRHLEASQVTEKARNDLVTEADRGSETAILSFLAEADPGCSILAEESGLTGIETADTDLWIVDPLDGTTNFVHGFPHFAVSVAVARGGALLAGAIYDPVKEDLFTAVAGGGASWNGRPCSVSSRPALEGAFLATGFPFRAHRLLDPYLAIFRDVFLRSKAIRRAGAAALDLAYTAAGLFDGFFEFQLSPWDIAAGALMVLEAGGIVTDMEGGGQFLKSGDLLCGPPGVHRELLGVVASHSRAWHGSS